MGNVYVGFGVGAITKITDTATILAKQGIRKVLVVTGKGSHIKSGAWGHVEQAFAVAGIAPVLYSKITPNPTVDQVDEATQLAMEFGAQALLLVVAARLMQVRVWLFY